MGAAADVEFLADIAATNSDVSSGLGSTSLADITADIMQLLGLVDYAQSSRLWLVVDLIPREVNDRCSLCGGHYRR